MKGKRIWKRILVAALAMSLVLPNVSVAAQEGETLGNGTAGGLSSQAEAGLEDAATPSASESDQPSTGETQTPSTPEDSQPSDGSQEPPTTDSEQPSEPDAEQPSEEDPQEPSSSEGEQPGTEDGQEPGEEPGDGTDEGLAPGDGDQDEGLTEGDGTEDSDSFIDSDMSIPELETLPADKVGAAVQRCYGVDFFGVAPADDMDQDASDASWRFNAYYVNQPDDYDVEKDDDFSLKYQIEFHTDAVRAPGEVEIRIPATLLTYRGTGDQINMSAGRKIMPNQIALPKGSGWGEGQYTNTKSSPFNYRIDETTGEIVFFNYRQISAGSNAAWQVLYENLDIMEIVDGTEWSLQPVAKVGGKTKRTRPLTGRTHSGVTLNSVSKTPYQEVGKIYAPLLYTQAQVERYLDGALPADYAGENFGKWKFAVWRVQVKGFANQPWNMALREAPVAYVKNGAATISVPGAVVGYKDDASQASGYNVPLENTDSAAGTVITGCREENWGSRFYVVTAYPARVDAQGRPSAAEGSIELKKEDILENSLTVEIQPVDGGEPQQGTDTASVAYENYRWEYRGNAIGVEKISDPTKDNDEARSQKDYKSWWEAYWQSAQNGQDYGDLEFYTEGEFRGYDYTHVVSSEEGNGEPVGKYRPGTSYELITVDDFMYAQAYSKSGGVETGAAPIPIGKEDYYYSAVTVTQSDRGYDISEEQYDEPEFPGEMEGNIDRAVHIYAMFAKGKNADGTYGDNPADTWEEVAVVPWNPSGTMTYTFSEEDLRREPWRIKAVHKTVEYSTTCDIDVKVRLRANPSEAFQAFLDQYTSGGTDSLTYVKLEDLSGVMGACYQDGVRKAICHNPSAGNVVLDGNGNVTDPGDANYGSYSATQIAQDSWDLYGEEYCAQDDIRRLPQRDNASVSLYGAYKEAQAFKEAAISNDAVNGRMVVDYFLTAYDGYQVYDEDGANYLSSMVKSPGNKYVMFYDLLPYGMYFDPSAEVVAGRLTQLDDRGYYKNQPNRWDEKGVSVSMDAGTDIIEDWNGTGRTMLIFHIAYTGGDPSVYTDGKWMEGWGLSFRAYCQWKDMDSVKSQHNASAFMPDASEYGKNGLDTPFLLGGAGEVYPDDGQSYPDGEAYEAFRRAGTSLNPENVGSTTPNVLFADKRIEGDIATHDGSKIEKQVHADDDTFNDFGESAYVRLGEDYTYRISMEVSSGKDVSALKDIVVFDHLENAAVERIGNDFNDSNQELLGDTANNVVWHGSFRGVDVDWLKGQEWELEVPGQETARKVRVHIQPKIWYNAARNATTTNWTKGDGDTAMTFRGDAADAQATPDSVLTAQNGWYEEAAYIEEYRKTLTDQALAEEIAAYKERHSAQMEDIIAEYRKACPDADGDDAQIADAAATRALALETVGSIAVDLRKCADGDGNAYDFVLGREETMNFQIRMTATDDERYLTMPKGTGDGTDSPEDAGYKVPYAFNNPAFYSCAVATGTQSTVAGDSVRVTIGSRKKLEIVKQLSGNVPAQARDTDFRFRVYRQGGEALSNRAYTLWNWTEDADSESGYGWKQDTSRLYATDGEGYLTLKGEQRAVFQDLPDADTIRVEEEKNIFWRVEYAERTSREEEGNTLTYTQTVTNHYRPVLYVRKKLDGVPESKLEEVKDSVFTMQITREGRRGELDYCQVDAMPGSGRLPQIIGEVKKTVNEGRFQIKESEIIAVFLDLPGMKYELQEIMDADDGKGEKVEDNWICQNPTVTGTVPYDGDKQTIINHYMWKDLYLTKRITGKELDEETAGQMMFQFQVCRLEEGEEGQTREIPLPQGTAWTIVDEDGNALPPENGGAQGAIGENGMFEAPCGNRTVRIEGLKADCTYVVREIVDPEADYLPENAEKEVWIPVYGAGQETEFVNVYQWCSLQVSKDVVSVDGNPEADTAQFRMVIAERTGEGTYRILRDHPYGMLGQEAPEMGEEPLQTDGYGIFTLRNGETAVFEDLGRIGAEYLVWEIQDSEYMQISPASDTVETVSFDDGTVMEAIAGESGKAMLRIAPAQGAQDALTQEVKVGAPVRAELVSAGADADFVNGEPGALLLGKEYVAGDAYMPDQMNSMIQDEKEYLGASQGDETEPGGSRDPGDIARTVVESVGRALGGGSLGGSLGGGSLGGSLGGGSLGGGLGGNLGDLDQSTQGTIDAKEVWEQILSYMENNPGSSDLGLQWNLFEEHLNRRWGEPGEGKNWDVKARITVDGQPYEIDTEQQLICIDNLSGLKYTLEYRGAEAEWYIAAVDGTELGERSRQVELYDEAGNLIVHPWMTYVLYMEPGAEYSIEEVDCLYPISRTIVRPKYPAAGESAMGTVESDPVVTLCNELKMLRGSLIEKRMTADSSPVGKGKTLVWRVERYDASAGEWLPAEGIEYCITEEKSDGWSGAGISYADIQKTGKDGKIRLSRSTDNGEFYLAVQFIDDVYLNVNEGRDGALRVVELLGESDAVWGELVGYGGRTASDYYSMDLPFNYAYAFVNSNSTFPVEVQKLTDTGMEDTFTMILKRGVYDRNNVGTFSPYGGMPYTVYQEDEETGETKEIRSDVTTDKGEIFLGKGQYARLNLATEFIWTVSEDTASSPNYELTDMTGEHDKKHIFTEEQADTMRIDPSGTESGTTSLTQADVTLGTYDGDGKLVNLTEGDVEIPQYITRNGRKLKVVRIDDIAFRLQMQVTSVKIPEGVQSIGKEAFASCTRLTSVEIPQSMESIGASAFSGCRYLETVTIPDNVKSIGECAFLDSGLRSVKIGSGVDEIAERAFANCMNLASVEISEGVERIGDYAFSVEFGYSTSLEKVVIPDSVTRIGEGAFRGCIKLKEIVIGEGVEEIGAYAFAGLWGYVPWFGGNASSLNESLQEITIPNNVKVIGEGAFQGCSMLSQVKIGLGVRTIGDYAFAGIKLDNSHIIVNSALTEIAIPGNVETIGEGAFYCCIGLEQIVLEEGIKTIGEKAFAGDNLKGMPYKNEDLAEINIPASVTRIDTSAFQYCSNLNKVTFQGGTLPEILSGAFYRCSDTLKFLLNGTETDPAPEVTGDPGSSNTGGGLL